MNRQDTSQLKKKEFYKKNQTGSQRKNKSSSQNYTEKENQGNRI